MLGFRGMFLEISQKVDRVLQIDKQIWIRGAERWLVNCNKLMSFLTRFIPTLKRRLPSVQPR